MKSVRKRKTDTIQQRMHVESKRTVLMSLSAGQEQRGRCRDADAEMQVSRCRCRDADVEMQVQTRGHSEEKRGWGGPREQHDGGLVAESCPTLATPWMVSCQSPLSMGFSRQDY